MKTSQLQPAQPTSSFVQFMQESPLMGLELDFDRDQSLPRDVVIPMDFDIAFLEIINPFQ